MTKDHGIFFPKEVVNECIFYSNANRACDIDKRNSMMGLFKFNMSIILWRCKLQLTMALSTIEAKHRALQMMFKR